MRSIVVSLCLIATTACSSTDPADSRVIGVVHPGLSDIPAIVAPDTVVAGSRFTVVIHTFGSASCTTPAGVSRQLSSRQAFLIPYDILTTSSTTACTRDYSPIPHQVELTFVEVGAARIAARGMSVGGIVPGKKFITLTKNVWVLPRTDR